MIWLFLDFLNTYLSHVNSAKDLDSQSDIDRSKGDRVTRREKKQLFALENEMKNNLLYDAKSSNVNILIHLWILFAWFMCYVFILGNVVPGWRTMLWFCMSVVYVDIMPQWQQKNSTLLIWIVYNVASFGIICMLCINEKKYRKELAQLGMQGWWSGGNLAFSSVSTAVFFFLTLHIHILLTYLSLSGC